MTKDEALRLALEALESTGENNGYHGVTQYFDEAMVDQAITAIKAALEAKDEKANDELRRLHDLLGKANALARIRANKIDELEQRLTKTEAQLGEAVWNYGELKREQLANQQKTSGSPINTSAALEAKDEPVALKMDVIVVNLVREGINKHRARELAEHFVKHTTPLQPVIDESAAKRIATALGWEPKRTWVGLTDEEKQEIYKQADEENWHDQPLLETVEAKLKEKNT